MHLEQQALEKKQEVTLYANSYSWVFWEIKHILNVHIVLWGTIIPEPHLLWFSYVIVCRGLIHHWMNKWLTLATQCSSWEGSSEETMNHLIATSTNVYSFQGWEAMITLITTSCQIFIQLAQIILLKLLHLSFFKITLASYLYVIDI